MAESDQFSEHCLAALLTAKVYFHLNDLSNSVKFALLAGDLFDITKSSQFVDTIADKALDVYKSEQELRLNPKEALPPINSRLEALFNRKCDLALGKGEFRHVMGLAIDGRRLDLLERCLRDSGDMRFMLSECMRLSLRHVPHRDFRQRIFSLLLKLHSTLTPPDLFEMCELHLSLNEPEHVADMLMQEVGHKNKPVLMQLAFNLHEASPQLFLRIVQERLKAASAGMAGEEAELVKSVQTVLSGEPGTDLRLRFLFTHNQADPLNMSDIKARVDQRASITHSGAVYAHALMYAGTACDTFLRANEEFIARASNFAKMAVTSSIGVVHYGHIKEGMSLLGQFLPAATQTAAHESSPFSEAGALYALGLINANHGAEATEYLKTALGNAGASSNVPVVQHGASLGLGCAAMGSGDLTLFEDLKGVLFTDNAVSGEASAYAIGMVLLGSGLPEPVREMLAYAHETKHDKITRALGIGVALIMCGREEQADVAIEQMCNDQDALLRYGGMFCAGLAYCGNPNHPVLTRLLRAAVSDASDDVRRAAVMAVGLLLSRDPDSCPKTLKLLAESFNPHVRYGVAFALGIACVATGNPDAVAMLRHMMEDRIPFVRQAACIGLAMVFMLRNDAQEPKMKDVRAEYFKLMEAKSVDSIVKFGAMLASGLIDAGGRNVTIALHTSSGMPRLNAIAGLTLFLQFWYWHPLIHCLALAFQPTAVIAVNSDIKMPVFSFRSNAKPSLFAYPPKRQPPAKDEVKKGPAAVLSVTAKEKEHEEQRRKEKEKEKEGKKEPESAPMEVEKPAGPAAAASSAGPAAAAAGAPPPAASSSSAAAPVVPAEGEKKPEEKKEEPAFEILQNPARVTPDQRKFVVFDNDARYTPVRPSKKNGVLVLVDRTPDQAASLIAEANLKVDDEAPMPEPFEYP